jgi:hypothetical protein
MGKQEMTLGISTMTHRIFSTVLGVLVLSSVGFCQPKLAISGGAEQDWGQIYTGKKFHKDISIRNTGKDTLEIRNVSAACGCTAVLLQNDRIAPGDSSTLAITFNANNYSGPTSKSITFSTNDPEQKSARFLFKTYVIKTFDISPDYLVMKTKTGIVSTDTVKIKNTGLDQVKILSITSSRPEVKISSSANVLKPGETAYIELSFTPTAVGAIKGDLTIATDNTNMPTLDIRYFGMVTKE